MINSLPPSVFPTPGTAITTTEQPPAGQTSEQSDPARIAKTTAARTHKAHHGRHDRGRFREADGSDLFQTTKHMLKEAFRDFRHDLRESFSDLGFDGGLANRISKGVMHAARDALRSGVDFSANLMVAAISQISSTGASGTSSSFSMVASSIEVNINHTTGSIDVSMMKMSIDGQFNDGLGGAQPHLLDIRDSGQGQSPDLSGVLLALQNLGDIFDSEEDTNPEPAAQPVVVPTAREELDNQLGQSTDTSTTRTAVGTVLQSEATGEDVPAEKADETEAVEEVTEEAAKTDPALPEIVTPLLLNRPEYSARIFITAYEHSINDREERITFLRFDAIVPLSAKSTAPADETPPQSMTKEEPAAGDLKDQPVTTVA